MEETGSGSGLGSVRTRSSRAITLDDATAYLSSLGDRLQNKLAKVNRKRSPKQVIATIEAYLQRLDLQTSVTSIEPLPTPASAPPVSNSISPARHSEITPTGASLSSSGARLSLYHDSLEPGSGHKPTPSASDIYASVAALSVNTSNTSPSHTFLDLPNSSTPHTSTHNQLVQPPPQHQNGSVPTVNRTLSLNLRAQRRASAALPTDRTDASPYSAEQKEPLSAREYGDGEDSGRIGKDSLLSSLRGGLESLTASLKINTSRGNSRRSSVEGNRKLSVVNDSSSLDVLDEEESKEQQSSSASITEHSAAVQPTSASATILSSMMSPTSGNFSPSVRTSLPPSNITQELDMLVTILYGDLESKFVDANDQSDVVNALLSEHTDLLAKLIAHLPELSFEGRKDLVRIVEFILRTPAAALETSAATASLLSPLHTLPVTPATATNASTLTVINEDQAQDWQSQGVQYFIFRPQILQQLVDAYRSITTPSLPTISDKQSISTPQLTATTPQNVNATVAALPPLNSSATPTFTSQPTASAPALSVITNAKAATDIQLVLVSDMLLRCLLTHRDITAKFLNIEPSLVLPFVTTFIQYPTFDVSSHAFDTLKLVLTTHIELVVYWLSHNFETFFEAYNNLLRCEDYHIKYPSWLLLYQLLSTPACHEVSQQYISSADNLKLAMMQLRAPSKQQQLACFHVLKLFICNPDKPDNIARILLANRDPFIAFLELFEKETEDTQIVANKLEMLMSLEALTTV